jgi:hypothetical protein
VSEGNVEELMRLLQKFRQQGKSVGCIVHSHELSKIESGDSFKVLPSPIEFLARYLFRTLRELDQGGANIILVEQVTEGGLGDAVMDRLRRTAEPA